MTAAAVVPVVTAFASGAPTDFSIMSCVNARGTKGPALKASPGTQLMIGEVVVNYLANQSKTVKPGLVSTRLSFYDQGCPA